MNVFVGIMIPFLGTAAGAAMVFFMRDAIKPAVQKMLLGFASGVMIAASVWSLLIPAMDMAAGLGKLAFIPAAVGFLLGIFFLLLLDHVIPHMHIDRQEVGRGKFIFERVTQHRHGHIIARHNDEARPRNIVVDIISGGRSNRTGRQILTL